MVKYIVLGFMTSALVMAFALSSIYATDAPADGAVLNHMGGMEVTFNHSAHSALDCAECHHQGGEDYQCTASGCHDIMDKKDKTPASWYNAVHSKKASLSTCVSCHTENAGDDKDKKKELAGCKGSACHP